MTTKKFKIDRTAALLAVQRAVLGIDTEHTMHAPHMRGLMIHRLQMDIATCMGMKKFGDAIRAEGELAKLLGLHAPTRIQVTGDDAIRDAIGKVASSMTAEQREKMVEEQLALERFAKQGMNGHAKKDEHHG